MSDNPTSTLALGIVMVCIGFLAIDMRAFWYGGVLIFSGLLFICANLTNPE